MPRDKLRALFSIASSLLFRGSTLSAAPPAVSLINSGVLWRKLMPVYAMRLAISSAFVCCYHSLQFSLGECADVIRVNNFSKRKPRRRALDNSVCFQLRGIGKLYSFMPSAFDIHVARTPLVALLLTFGRPTAIIWRVVTVVVFALDRRARRAWRHIGLKRGVVVKPAIAHFNASPAVIFVRNVSRCVATAFHGLPNRVQGRRFFERHINNQCGGLGRSISCPATYREN